MQKMHLLLTFDTAQRQTKVNSGVTAPGVDGYGPMISNKQGVIH